MPGEVIPLRPLTLSELLDAALELLRRNALGLLPVSAALALVEQVALYPVRAVAVSSWRYSLFPAVEPLAYLLLVAAGLGAEVAIIAVLGGLAARAAVPALVDGAAAPRWLLGRDSRLGSLLVLATLLAPVAVAATILGLVPANLPGGSVVVAWLIWLAAFVPWSVWYLFTGLAAPAVVIEGRGPLSAVGRSFAMVVRGRLRPGLIRLLGYVAWFLVRQALAYGSLAAVRLFVHPSGPVWPAIVTIAVSTMVNSVAFAALGCLDAVLHLENRMRVEGLDLALSRGLRRGVRPEQILAG